MPSSIKPRTGISPAFVADRNRMKAGGLDKAEMKTLLDEANKDIAQSKTPVKTAWGYRNEMKGWVQKGLTKDKDTVISAMVEVVNTGTAKSIADGAKYLKANAAKLQAAYPSLKKIDFSKLELRNSGYMQVVDTAGKQVFSNDKRCEKLLTILMERMPDYDGLIGLPDPDAAFR